MKPAVQNTAQPVAEIRARVAARLYAQPAQTRAAGQRPRSAAKKSRSAVLEAQPSITFGQVFRAGLVLVVGLTLAPMPRFDGAPPPVAPIIAPTK